MFAALIANLDEMKIVIEKRQHTFEATSEIFPKIQQSNFKFGDVAKFLEKFSGQEGLEDWLRNFEDDVKICSWNGAEKFHFMPEAAYWKLDCRQKLPAEYLME